MNKKIITIAEIVFALIFVVLLAVFMATINSKGNSANNQLVDVLESTDSSNVKSYTNGGTMKGSTVEMAIDQINSLAGDVNTFKIMVTTHKNKDKSEVYQIYTKENGYSVSDTQSDYYINPKADFKCWHEINANGIITGLVFAQSGTADFGKTTNPYVHPGTIPDN